MMAGHRPIVRALETLLSPLVSETELGPLLPRGLCRIPVFSNAAHGSMGTGSPVRTRPPPPPWEMQKSLSALS